VIGGRRPYGAVHLGQAGQGLTDDACLCHVILTVLDPHVISQMASHDMASLPATSLYVIDPHILNQMASHDVAIVHATSS